MDIEQRERVVEKLREENFDEQDRCASSSIQCRANG